MPSQAASERVWEAVESIISSKRALTTPMSSWIVDLTGSSEILDTLIHPAAPPPVVHADIDDKRVNLKKELQNIRLALGFVDRSAEDADDENEDASEKGEDEVMQEEEEAEDEKEVAAEVQTDVAPQKPQEPQHIPTSTASANGQLDFAVPKDEPQTFESITTARPPPVESTKSFSNPLPLSNQTKEDDSDDEMPSIDID